MVKSKNIEFSMATESDLPQILNMYSQPDMDGDALPLTEALLLFREVSKNPNHLVYVARRGKEVVGTFCIVVVPMLSHKGSRMGILEDVVVCSDQQGQGIGKQMMLFANERCKELGCYKIVLSSAMHRDRTHKFYEGLGFTKHGYSFYL